MPVSDILGKAAIEVVVDLSNRVGGVDGNGGCFALGDSSKGGHDGW
jgi:hypothetical protein